MTDKIMLCFICRFPAWGENKEYPAFGVKYLIEVPIETAQKEEGATNFFKEKFKEHIKKDFDGEILFVEEAELVILN